MKGKLHLIFDWKVMGVNAYIPFIVVVLLIGYGSLRRDALTHIIPALELTFPVFAAWWSIFLFQDVLEEPGGETLFSLPVKRWKLGVVRVGIFFGIYIFLMFLMLFIIDQWCVVDLLLPLALQLGAEAYFFAGLGFLAMSVTLNTGWSLVVIIAYTSTQILTRGALLPLINVFLFNERLLPISELWMHSGYTILLGGGLWFGAQFLFSKLQHFN